MPLHLLIYLYFIYVFGCPLLQKIIFPLPLHLLVYLVYLCFWVSPVTNHIPPLPLHLPVYLYFIYVFGCPLLQINIPPPPLLLSSSILKDIGSSLCLHSCATPAALLQPSCSTVATNNNNNNNNNKALFHHTSWYRVQFPKEQKNMYKIYLNWHSKEHTGFFPILYIHYPRYWST